MALGGPRDELTDLSDTLDEMLDRMEAGYAAQRFFAANASHELRTPLATEKAMLDMLLDGPEPSPAEYRAVVERVREVNARSISLVTGLLQLTRAQVDGRGLDEGTDTAEVTDLLRRPLRLAEEIAEARGISLRAELTPHRVSGQPVLLGQLLENLLGNAARHATESTRIDVSWRPVAGQSQFRVSNVTGALTAEVRQRLTEPFVRGLGRVHQASGTGLGLAIASAIAEAHGGRLSRRATSATEFSVLVTLPLPWEQQQTPSPGLGESGDELREDRLGHLGGQPLDDGQERGHLLRA